MSVKSTLNENKGCRYSYYIWNVTSLLPTRVIETDNEMFQDLGFVVADF